MRRVWTSILALLSLSAAGAAPAPVALVHTDQQFRFSAAAPLDVVAPLFGADKERVWAKGWAPDFLWPATPADQDGMVFTTAFDDHTAIWVNTAFDLKAGHIQYVYLVPGKLVTRITLALQPQSDRTEVQVRYERTALSPDANGEVLSLSQKDAAAGPEWESSVNAALRQ